MMNLRVHDCLTIIIMPISLFKLIYLYSLVTYAFVGTTIQERVVTASIGTYICDVLVNDGYCSRLYGIMLS